MAQKFKSRLNQRGFMLLELIVVMGIIGILATIAVPKFTETLTQARTSKVQADLQVINSAVVLYQADYGLLPTTVKPALAEYINNINTLAPPDGTVYLKGGSKLDVTGKEYTLTDGEATLDGHRLEDFGKK